MNATGDVSGILSRPVITGDKAIAIPILPR
ncbi:hypothetical protein SAMN04488128_101838 [Chitinophaga eiseniae]|uniref:Uncharacterized protein n=1 Tax=Chitinophaga eiseniae TaxID=634771 RepID=A0A1T4LX15_9BACT|nr:hypothetical protein SAMN04488128_101838 [Chitinophaga eiseniae]